MDACARCGSTTADLIPEFYRGEPDQYGVTLKSRPACADQGACLQRQLLDRPDLLAKHPHLLASVT